MAKQRTITGAYSAADVNRHNKDKIRDTEIGPKADMGVIKSYASAIDSNSGRNAGFAAPIRPGAGTVVSRIPPHGSENQREVPGLAPKRSKPGARWERG
jgi:hypothetical protein